MKQMKNIYCATKELKLNEPTPQPIYTKMQSINLLETQDDFVSATLIQIN